MTAPTNQTFVSGTTISSEWLNGVNDHVNDLEVAAHTASNIQYTPAGTGATERSVENKLREVVSVKDFGAACDGTTNDTDAVKAAVAYINSTGGTLEFPGICAVYDEIVVDANVVKLKGTKGKTNGGLSLKSAGAKLRIGGNGTNRYLGSVEDFIIVGNNTATTLMEMTNAGEFSIKNLLLTTCSGVGLKLTGAITGILKIIGLQTNGVSNPVRFINNGNVWFDGCNFYNSDKIFTFSGAVSNIVVRDTWMETYNYAVDFDSSANYVDVFGFRFRDCYFQSTLGGASKTSRIVRSYCANDTYRNRVYGLSIVGGNVYHTASEFLIEVDWNGYSSGGLNKLQGVIDEVQNNSPAGVTAWIKSDVTNTDLPWIDLKYGDANANLVQIAVDYDINLTGGTRKLPANTAVPSVSDQAPLYVTQNSVATTITNFSGAHAGQVVRVLVRDANTTFKFAGSSTFSGNKGADYAALNGDFLDFRYDGTMWHASIGNETKRSGTATVTLNSGGLTAITHGLGATAKMFKVSPRGSTPYFVTTNPANSADTCTATFYTAAGAAAAYTNVTFDWEASL